MAEEKNICDWISNIKLDYSF